MRSHSFLRLIAVACVAGALGACSDANAPEPAVPDEVVTTDLALSAGDAIAADVGFLIGGELDGMSIGGPAAGLRSETEPRLTCTLGSDGRHVCTGTTPNGLSITRSFAFYDAANVIQPRFDHLTTASINFQLSVSGTLTRDNHTATISRTRDQTLSGLAGTETQRTWNGTGRSSHNGTATGDRGTRTYAMTSNDTTTNVVFALPRSEHPWPQSGSIIHNMTSTATLNGAQTSTRTVTRRAQVTFNGTSTVPLQIGDRTCTLNLETRAVSCPDGTRTRGR